MLIVHTYVAVDIGASSGRLILGQIENGKLKLQEMHRFKNEFIKNDGHDRWQIDHLIKEILLGLEKIKKSGFKNVNLGIDTWGVDYVLVDATGKKIQNPISYRDKRTQSTIAKVTASIPPEIIYQKTGIQFLNFNTIYQLFEEDPKLLAKTEKIMLIPDYLGFVLTGKAVMETTNASTTQLLNLKEKKLDPDLLKMLGVKFDQFPTLVSAGTKLGPLKKEWYRKYDLPKTKVVTVATHDTASAVVGTPGFGNNWAFLSSGTWSLLGCELIKPNVSNLAYQYNYTNEWNAYGSYRFLKNIMGLWIIQRVQKELNPLVDFNNLVEMAQHEVPFQQYIDVNDQRFINPKQGMITELQNYCRQTKQVIPQTPGELAMAVYSNLALYYTYELKILDQILNRKTELLNIVGGGSQVNLVNQLTASMAQIVVKSGPIEATAVGNIIVQMIANNELTNLSAGRELIFNSFTIKQYLPQSEKYLTHLVKYEQFLKNKGKK